MKKFLLSIAAVACFTGYAMADTVTLSFADVEEETIDGTFNDEQLKDDGSLQQAPNYQPIVSFEVSNFVFSFTQGNAKSNPALFLTPSTNANTKPTVRVYGTASEDGAADGNTMTVTAPEGVVMSKIVFAGGSSGTANAAQEASIGEVSGVTASGMTWTYDEGTNSVTFTFIKNARFATATVTTGTAEENGGNTETTEGIFSSLNESDANGADGWEFENVTLDENLTYVWSWKSYNDAYYLNASGYNKQAYASEAYAISPVIDMTNYKNCTVSFDHAAKFQTTLRDLCGLYVREEGAEGWENELTIPTWPDAGSWTFANSGDISLSAYDGKKIQLAFLYGSTSEGSDTWEIKNFVVDGEAAAGVQAVVADTTNAPVVYYNLQGQRVANPAQGLYIRVQGSKVEKVALR
jgi:hypothetical protein